MYFSNEVGKMNRSFVFLKAHYMEELQRTVTTTNRELQKDLNFQINEVEFTIRSGVGRYSVIYFDRLSRVLKRLYGAPQINYQLIVQPESFGPVREFARESEPTGVERVIISGLDEIMTFCNKATLTEASSVIQQKKTVKSAKNFELEKEYNVRLRLSEETELPFDSPVKNTVLDKTTNKLFRYRKRYTYRVAEQISLQFDLSVVKAGRGKTFADAIKIDCADEESSKQRGDTRLLDGFECYDVELELFGQNVASNANSRSGPKDSSEMTPLLDALYLALQVRDNTSFVIKKTEIATVLRNYARLTGQSFELAKNLANERNVKSSAFQNKPSFIGANVYPLGLQNVLDPKKYPEFAKNNVNLDEYIFSFKTDGERNLFFFDERGQSYLIDNNLVVKKTDVVDQKFANSLFDVELVTVRSSPDDLPKYYQIWTFDVIYFNNVSVAQQPLEPNRFDIIEQLSTRQERERVFFLPQKIFYQSESFGEMVAKKQAIGFSHDGIILTHMTRPYPIRLRSADRKTVPEWGFTFKVKNLDQLTIDFLVRQTSDARDCQTAVEIGQAQTLKKFNLLVSQGTQQDAEKKVFTPVYKVREGYNYACVRSNIQQEAGQTVQSLRTDEDHFPIYPNFVYECVYNPDNGGWAFMRHRPTKTISNKPNAFFTANSTWDMILNIISNPTETLSELTEDNLLLLMSKFSALKPVPPSFNGWVNQQLVKPPIFYNSASATVYTRSQADKALIEPMTKMHNQIKALLYTTVCNAIRNKQTKTPIRLLEFASGAGGDYLKWLNAGVTEVVGIEFDGNQISAALARPSKEQIKVTYINGDMTKPFEQMGVSKQEQGKIKKLEKASFDLVSCQFAIHFAMSSRAKFETFINNVSTSLKPGGYFIGTNFVAARTPKEVSEKTIGAGVYQALEQQNPLIYERANKTVWSIAKKYTEQELLPFGQLIDVFVASLYENGPVSEPLAHLMSKEALEVTNSARLRLVAVGLLGADGQLQPFGSIYEAMRTGSLKPISMGVDANPLKQLEALYADERLMEFSRFNSVFIYQKV
jgi:ubiquinone/menaquinone biosynthesis C-methylase UbiE